MSLRWFYRRFRRLLWFVPMVLAVIALLSSLVLGARLSDTQTTTVLGVVIALTAGALVLLDFSPVASRNRWPGNLSEYLPRRWGEGLVPEPLLIDEQFSGRERELRELVDSHDHQRKGRTGLDRTAGPVLLLIHGKPGVGKSTLARELIRRLSGRYPDGLFIANLGTAGAPRLPGEILKDFLLDLGWDEDEMPRSTVGRATIFRSLIAGKRMLFLLDAAQNADQVLQVLPSNSAATIVVTSRRDLGPSPGLRLLSWRQDNRSAAVSYRLDVPDEEQALAMFRTLSGTDVLADPECALEIVDYCGRLPLAIRSAAESVSGQADICAVARLLAAPTPRLGWLERPGRPVRAGMRAEYDRLLLDERRAFGLLALVPSATFMPGVLSWLLEVPMAQAQAIIDRLEAAQLIDEVGPGEPEMPARYGFHPLIRLFAQEQAERLSSHDRRQALARWDSAYQLTVGHVLARLDGGDHPPPLGVGWMMREHRLVEHIVEHPEYWVRMEYANLLRVVRAAVDRGDHHLCAGVAWWLRNCVPAEVDVSMAGAVFRDAFHATVLAEDIPEQVDVLLAEGTFLSAVERYGEAVDVLDAAARKARGVRLANGASVHAMVVREAIARRKIGEAYLQAASYRQAAIALEDAQQMIVSTGREDQERLLRLLVAEAHQVDIQDPDYLASDSAFSDTFRYRAELGLAESARLRGRWLEAHGHLDRALRIVPGDLRRAASVQYRKARLFLDSKQAMKAAGCATSAAVAFQRMANPVGLVRAHCLLVRAFVALDRLIDAEEMIGAAERELACLPPSAGPAIEPLRARVWWARAAVLHQRGAEQAAFRLLTDAADILAEHEDWSCRQAVLHLLEDIAPSSDTALELEVTGTVDPQILVKEAVSQILPPRAVMFRGAMGAELVGADRFDDTGESPVWHVPINRRCELTVALLTGRRAFADGSGMDFPVWEETAIVDGPAADEMDVTIQIDAPFVELSNRRLTASCRVDEGELVHHCAVRVTRPGRYDLYVALLSADRIVQTLPFELWADPIEAGE